MDDKPYDREELRKTIITEMERCNLDDAALSAMTGVPKSTINGWHHGTKPTRTIGYKVLRALRGANGPGNLETPEGYKYKGQEAPICGAVRHSAGNGEWGEACMRVAALPEAFRLTVNDSCLVPIAWPGCELEVDHTRQAADRQLCLADIASGAQPARYLVGFLQQQGRAWYLCHVDRAKAGPPFTVPDPAKAWPIVGMRLSVAAGLPSVELAGYRPSPEGLTAVADDEEPPTEAEAADARDAEAERKVEESEPPEES